ncbi:MAG: hypothetical protein KGJ23_07930 [Euryarchaeota archaeon]|nr:hypothetical protein [Euryarchaeota archaeon]MDE1836529.1 hypothetical protein [Euryarchaeota archaeon]MDE1879276.1 hypothetical protein [Euryarchaeota archaeon]MDE2044499.1 hypothetical protein [Thermoplasmata archaeon]
MAKLTKKEMRAEKRDFERAWKEEHWKNSRTRIVVPVDIIDTMDDGESRAVRLPPGAVRVLVRKGDEVVLKVPKKYVQEKTFLLTRSSASGSREMAKRTGLTVRQRGEAQKEFDAIAKVVGNCPQNVALGLLEAKFALSQASKEAEGELDRMRLLRLTEEVEGLVDELEDIESTFVDEATEKLRALAEKLELERPSWMEG